MKCVSHSSFQLSQILNACYSSLKNYKELVAFSGCLFKMYFLKLQAVKLILQNIGEVRYFTVKFLQFDDFFFFSLSWSYRQKYRGVCVGGISVLLCTEGITLGVTLQVKLHEYSLVCVLHSLLTLVFCATAVGWLGKNRAGTGPRLWHPCQWSSQGSKVQKNSSALIGNLNT